MRTSSELRALFIDYFRERGHVVVPSASLVPADDPTLLFTTAGMVQFKKLYTGAVPLPYTRACSVQKCLRTTDLDNVGRTPRHGTFLEMLGNFSFGDYFKREAIQWGWEFLTKLLAIPPDCLWITVYLDDDEAYAIWADEIKIPGDRIVRLGKEDNFWGPAGKTGACGPCSEIHFDVGRSLCPDPDCKPGHSCNRFLEVWNLVFPQFDMQEDGTLAPLKYRGIDTGMGLERLCLVLQGKTSIQETDAFQPLLARLESMSGRRYAAETEDGAAMRIIADHTRALTFALAEGLFPSNEGRGYVLRRILRRASRRGRGLGLTDPFLHELSETVIATMGDVYPELRAASASITQSLRAEEERFLSTLSEGIARFEEVVAGLGRSKERTIPGSAIFTLYDTYGFPADMVEEMARERGLSVDLEAFEKEMEAQRERSRGASRFEAAGEGPGWTEVEGGDGTEFLGYETLEAEASVRRLRAGNPATVPPALQGRGEPLEIVLDRSPFYVEAGGQIGDSGTIETDGLVLEVYDTVRAGHEHVHRAVVTAGAADAASLRGRCVRARVGEGPRRATMRNHTATHLLHAALRSVLGAHATQAGSLVSPDRLRFDFSHFRPVSREEVRSIETCVNREVLADHPVVPRTMSFAEATKAGAMALFGEKYGDVVRMVEIPGVSRELCGGTHVARTGEIGPFRIVAEGSVASGTRRIEAVTGTGALEVWTRERDTVDALASIFQSGRDEIVRRVESLLEEREKLQKQLRAARTQGGGDLERLLAGARELDGVRLVAGEIEAEDIGTLREIGDRVRERLKSGVAVLGARFGGSVTILTIVTEDLVKARGLRADALVREVAKTVGGSGGGKPHLAQAGGKDAERLPEAIGRAEEVLRGMLGAR